MAACTGNNTAQELKDAAKVPKLSESINKLFGKCTYQGRPSTSKVKEIARKSKSMPQKGTKRTVVSIDEETVEDTVPLKKSDKSIVVEVVLMPKDGVVIPRGQYKQKLEDAGRVMHLKYKKSNSEEDIRAKIVALFPLILKDVKKPFLYMDARSKQLEKAVMPPAGHLQWNGEAIATLTGQGRLYILPQQV